MSRDLQAIFLAGLLAFVAGGTAQGESYSRVELRSAAEVSSETVRVSDLLPPNAPPDLQELAASVSLGHAPQPGSRRVLPGRFVEDRLGEASGLLERLRVPAQIVVTRAHRLLSRREILPAIQETLAEMGFAGAAAFREQDLMMPPVRVTAAEPGPELMEIDFDPLRKVTRFRLRLLQEPDVVPFFATSLVLVDLPAVVAGRELAAGETVQAEDLRMENRPARDSGKHPPVQPEQLDGQMPVRTIRRGQSVRREMFRAPVLVKAGQAATLLGEGKGFRLRIPVVALQRGTKGQMIRARNADTRRVFEAKVIGTGLLLATF